MSLGNVVVENYSVYPTGPFFCSGGCTCSCCGRMEAIRDTAVPSSFESGASKKKVIMSHAELEHIDRQMPCRHRLATKPHAERFA
jgi:hypothetical protein